jgi:hypothetical protein
MPMMARSIATAVTPTPARIILSAFGRDRDNGSAPQSKATMIKNIRKIGARQIISAPS